MWYILGNKSRENGYAEEPFQNDIAINPQFFFSLSNLLKEYAAVIFYN